MQSIALRKKMDARVRLAHDELQLNTRTFRRRAFIMLLGGVVAWPCVGRTQQSGTVRRIGVLMNGSASEEAPRSYLKAFVQALEQLGWTDGRNVRIDVRWNAGDAE